MSIRIACLALVFVSAACGASADDLLRAHDARYNTDFAKVWNVVSEEMHQRYVGIHIDDAAHGIIESDYRVVQNQVEDTGATTNTQATGGTAGAMAGKNAMTQQQNLTSYAGEVSIFRMTVLVQGPPWKVVVDGLAAKYDTTSPVPVPYHHGAVDEPPFVKQRIDNLSMAIYERLKPYIIEEKVKVENKHEVDLSTWANLGDRALVQVISGVRKAALDRDMNGLKTYMIADFHWAEGADTSSDTAVAIWAADPTSMRQLAATLDGGCVNDPNAQADVVCPPQQAANLGRVRFRQVGAIWKLVEYLR